MRDMKDTSFDRKVFRVINEEKNLYSGAPSLLMSTVCKILKNIPIVQINSGYQTLVSAFDALLCNITTMKFFSP